MCSREGGRKLEVEDVASGTEEAKAAINCRAAFFDHVGVNRCDGAGCRR